MATATAAVFPHQEAACSMGSSHCSMGSSHTLDQLDLRFDDPHAVANAGLLRAAATSQVLGHRVMAPSTVGTFLRAFTFGHVRQLDRLTERLLPRAWAAGAGPDHGPMTIDLDSTVCQVHGHASRAPPTAPPTPSATARCWPPAPTPARCSRARQRTGRATPPAAPPGSSRSWPPG